jgi:hypothetical protein
MIRAALRPDQLVAAAAAALVAFPGPLAECASLKQRANDLNSLLVQLSTQGAVAAVLAPLTAVQSPLVTAFAVLESDLRDAAERVNTTV